ncbi:hypothetical protein [Paenibacillus sp. O199]|nr:hypothetical protein [Paenibacillus sp. O199]
MNDNQMLTILEQEGFEVVNETEVIWKHAHEIGYVWDEVDQKWNKNE